MGNWFYWFFYVALISKTLTEPKDVQPVSRCQIWQHKRKLHNIRHHLLATKANRAYHGHGVIRPWQQQRLAARLSSQRQNPAVTNNMSCSLTAEVADVSVFTSPPAQTMTR